MDKRVMYVAILKYGCRIEKHCVDKEEATRYSKSLREQGFDIVADKIFPMALESNLNLH